METNQKQFLYRLYLVASVLIVLGLGIGYKIFHIQYIEGKNYRELAKNNTIQNFTSNKKVNSRLIQKFIR